MLKITVENIDWNNKKDLPQEDTVPVNPGLHVSLNCQVGRHLYQKYGVRPSRFKIKGESS